MNLNFLSDNNHFLLNKRIAESQHIVILTHISPDGDAMGSSLGLYQFLLSPLCPTPKTAEQVTVVLPTAVPGYLTWLPGAENAVVFDTDKDRATALLRQADWVVCSDFGEAKRIGGIEEVFRTLSCPVAVIDHHLHPTLEAEVMVSVPEASSASELMWRTVVSLAGGNTAIPAVAATCLYTGIMTDTGNFQFSCADPELYEIVAELLKTGIDKIDIYDRVFNQFSENRLRLQGYCTYRKMQILNAENVLVALITLDKKELYRFDFQSGDAEGIVNLPLQIGDVKYSVFMREDHNPDGTPKIKISFRSQGNRPVNIFAHEVFNGGGHANASGGEFQGQLADAVCLFMEQYRNYLH